MRRGTDAAPPEAYSIEVAPSRRLSDAAAARTTRHWRGEDGLWHAAELLSTPGPPRQPQPEELAALFCAFAGVTRYQTRVQRAAGWAA